jgi:hypothetical protein
MEQPGRGGRGEDGSPRRRALRGREVWLVDDVLTSGASASEAARVLKRMGASSVGVLVLARAGAPGASVAPGAPGADGARATPGAVRPPAPWAPPASVGFAW